MKRFTLRMTDDEYDRIKEAGVAARQTMTAYLLTQALGSGGAQKAYEDKLAKIRRGS